MGPVHLTVAGLDRSLTYYEDQVGLRVHARDGDTARLGTGEEDLLVLTELTGARPADGYAGLFHFALLLPDRPALAAWLAHAARDRVPLTGLSDHAVSEAIYLRDPDHHGIEIYADRPRAQWEGRVAELMTTLPLDTDDLLSTYDGAPWDGMAAGTTMGHVHFRVSDVPATTAFWRDTIGLDVMATLGPQAGFYAHGGYHHQVGANTWESRGAPPAPDGYATLVAATLLVEDDEARAAIVDRAGGDDLRDPSGLRLLLA